MIIAGRYSFNNGHETIQAKHPQLLSEIETVIATVGIEAMEERDKRKRIARLRSALEVDFRSRGWRREQIEGTYPADYYTNTPDHGAADMRIGRHMTCVKDKLGVELSFGENPMRVYSGCAKMTIFKNCGVIDSGIDIVPVKQLADEMSSGGSYFEQFVWDLEARGVADIDIPVLILGIDAR